MKLFLDDVRVPSDCIGYMPMRIGGNAVIYHSIDWVIVRDHYQFINWITKNGLPNLISFDHDLSDEHYSPLMYTSEDQYQEAMLEFINDSTASLSQGKAGFWGKIDEFSRLSSKNVCTI